MRESKRFSKGRAECDQRNEELASNENNAILNEVVSIIPKRSQRGVHFEY